MVVIRLSKIGDGKSGGPLIVMKPEIPKYNYNHLPLNYERDTVKDNSRIQAKGYRAECTLHYPVPRGIF